MSKNKNNKKSVKEIAKVRRVGSGRTKQSWSFLEIPQAVLIQHVSNPTSMVRISRKWAEAIGIKEGKSCAATDFGKVIVAANSAPVKPATAPSIVKEVSFLAEDKSAGAA